MKQGLLILWASCTLGVGGEPRAVEPQAYAVIYRLEGPGQGHLVDLEMQRGNLETLTLPNSTEQAFVRLPGRASSARFRDTSLRFVVRNRWPQTWSWSQLEPTRFRLVALKPEGESRILPLREHNAQRSIVHRGLPLKVTPRGADSVSLETVQPLASGEYAVYYSEGEEPCDLFCFAVESSSPSSP